MLIQVEVLTPADVHFQSRQFVQDFLFKSQRIEHHKHIFVDNNTCQQLATRSLFKAEAIIDTKISVNLQFGCLGFACLNILQLDVYRWQFLSIAGVFRSIYFRLDRVKVGICQHQKVIDIFLDLFSFLYLHDQPLNTVDFLFIWNVKCLNSIRTFRQVFIKFENN